MERQVDSAQLIEVLTRQIGALVVDNESLRLLLDQREAELAEALKALATRKPVASQETTSWGLQ